jgi:hypothetical protein
VQKDELQLEALLKEVFLGQDLPPEVNSMLVDLNELRQKVSTCMLAYRQGLQLPQQRICY